MYLSRLYISEKSQVKFHPGFNIILATNRVEPEEGDERVSDTNGVGKSTIVNIIKFMMCGNTENYLDSDFFTRNSIWPFLEISKQGKPYVLFASLQEGLKGKAYLVFDGTLEEHLENLKGVDLTTLTTLRDIQKSFGNKESYSVHTKDEYKAFLSRLEQIDYSDVNLKLSSLMDFICRDEKLGFGDPVFRLNRTNWVQYRAIQYLFGLPYQIEEKSNNFREEVLKLKQELEIRRSFLEKKGIHNQDNLEVKRIQLTEDLQEIEKDIAKVDLTRSNETIRKEYKKKKEELIRVNQEINYRESQVLNHRINIDELHEKEAAVEKLLEAEAFLEDIVEVFPELLKENIQKYNEFFDSLSKDRKEYHSTLLKDLEKNLKVLRSSKMEIENELKEKSSHFSNSDMIMDVSRLTAREEAVKSQIEQLKEAEKFLKECDVYEEDIGTKKASWETLLKSGKRIERSAGFNKFKLEMIKSFLFMVKECYQSNEGAIEFSYNDNIDLSSAGRTEIICSLSSDVSHGRTNAKICLFDFTWFLRERQGDEFNPEILIHDGPHAKISEHVKYRMFKMIRDLLGSSSKQYVITANDNEVPHLEEFKKNICITLDGSSEDGKFFGVQYE